MWIPYFVTKSRNVSNVIYFSLLAFLLADSHISYMLVTSQLKYHFAFDLNHSLSPLVFRSVYNKIQPILTSLIKKAKTLF